jgi:hypothetical protein
MIKARAAIGRSSANGCFRQKPDRPDLAKLTQGADHFRFEQMTSRVHAGKRTLHTRREREAKVKEFRAAHMLSDSLMALINIIDDNMVNGSERLTQKMQWQ